MKRFKDALTRLKRGFKRNKAAAIAVTVVLAVSAITHGWNMFGFPYYENDEATYVSRGWQVVNEGELDVYTYRYDHAPLGWVMLGFWQLLTGEEKLFSSLLVSGRVLMFLLAMACTYMVFVLTRRLTNGSITAAVIASLLFAVSPFSVIYHRRILLDNIMTFWVLLTMILATAPKPTLKHFMGSAVTFGIAVLTKLNAIFFLPALLFIIWRRANPAHRIHAGLYWLALTGCIIASFLLSAGLKGELLPAPVGANGSPTRVSFLDTMKLQAGRGDFMFPWEQNSLFRQYATGWLFQDWAVLTFGTFAIIVLTIIGIRLYRKQPLILGLALMFWCMLLFFMRGKIIFNFYIIPMIPLMTIAIGVLVHYIFRARPVTTPARIGVFSILIVSMVSSMFLINPQKPFTANEINNQLKAVDWVKQNLPEDAIIVADNYAYPFLSQEANFKKVSYFFPAEYDPEVREVYNNDWRDIEYILLTHEIVEQMENHTIPGVQKAFEHSTLIADFSQNSTAFVDFNFYSSNNSRYISTNGDWAQIYKVKDRNSIVGQDTWNTFKKQYIVDYGQVVNPDQQKSTSSMDQATAMVRAVSENDKGTFGGTWQWASDHFQYRASDRLLSGLWSKNAQGQYVATNTNADCDANGQMIYALTKAGKQWKDKAYTADAKELAADWWRVCVKERGGRLYVVAHGDGTDDLRPVDMGVFNPQQYRYLQSNLPGYDWQRLVNDGYAAIQDEIDTTGTVTDWRLLTAGGSLVPAGADIAPTANSFGRHNTELIIRLSHDYHVSRDGRAKAVISQLQPSLQAYDKVDVGPRVDVALALTTQILHPADRQKAFESAIAKNYKSDKGWWYGGKVYADQVDLWKWHYIQADVRTDKVTIR